MLSPLPATNGGHTDSASCHGEFPPAATPCLLQALKKHESHRAATPTSPGRASTRPRSRRRPITAPAGRSPTSIGAEIVGHTIDLDALQAELDALFDRCKLIGWGVTSEVRVRGLGSDTRGVQTEGVEDGSLVHRHCPAHDAGPAAV
jgi:hypothetical protein